MARFKDGEHGRPKAGTKGFLLMVLPSRAQLEEAILANGRCSPTDCWHYVAISAEMHLLDPVGNPHVRVDAGHVRVNYKGWRYTADTPRHVKRSLMLFDLGRYEEIYVRKYGLRFRRSTKIVEVPRERQDQINAARRQRIVNGSIEHKRHYPNLRARVEGFSAIV
jgi:hypothetical protein